MNSHSDSDAYSTSSNISVHSGTGGLSPYLNIDPSYLSVDGGAEFVFPSEVHKKRGWGERMFSSIGTAYMTGIAVGGVWGFYEGLKSPDGKTFKLRLNSVLNGCTRRGPFLANSLGIVALMYGCTSTAIEKLRGADDEYNSVAAAVTTGVMFKSTAGPRAIAVAGALGGGIAITYYAASKLWHSRGQTWTASAPNWA